MNISPYKNLKTELNICKTGGLFLALYRYKEQIDSIISTLEKDLPDFFSFKVEMTPKKVGFPSFFESSFNHTGKQSNIFHVIETQKLPQKLQTDFIAYLQFTRERFKSEKYAIVFWITPDFEKQITDSAIDFYDWITGTYDFSELESFCTDQKGEKIKLDNLLDDFISSDKENFLTLLGDFGTGKSSFPFIIL